MKTEISDNKSIAYTKAGTFEETRFEKIHNVIFESSHVGSILVAHEIANLIKEKNSLLAFCKISLNCLTLFVTKKS